MSAVNWAEVLSKVAEAGVAPERLAFELEKQGILGNTLELLPLTVEDSLEIARLRVSTKPLGLSLGDRACLALAKRLTVPVVTADRVWAEVPEVHVILIR